MIEIVGKCPICERDMWKGDSINRHHFTPKCRGGKETEFLHRVCHNKIHSIWTEKELEKEFNDPNKVIANEEMQKFIKWVKKKEPDFYDRNETHNRKK
jgi:hypothetical protein